jgi:hypothetical protein
MSKLNKRTFNSTVINEVVTNISEVLKQCDEVLAQMFENCFPNTLGISFLKKKYINVININFIKLTIDTTV